MSRYESSLVFDSLDIDLFAKVLSHTAFSPFFVFFIPVFYVFQGAKLTDPVIIGFGVYYVVISIFWFVQWYSRLYRNQGSLLFGPSPMDWGEQIVVITGGASGIGELLANTLAVRNVTVVVLDVNPIVTENYNITYYKCDVSKWEEVEAAAKTIREEIGDPTILINNAGVVQGKLLLDLTPEDVNQTFGVNTLAHFWTTKAFLPSMIENKQGHIVTISSVMGIVGAAQMTDYCASKAALVSFNESLRYELDHRYNCPKIRTTLVCPGVIQTPMFQTVKLPSSFLWKFLFPPLQPVTVVKRIIAALDEQHSQSIYLPFYTNFSPYVALLPSFLRDFAQRVTTANYAMTDFVKVSGRRSEEGPAPPLQNNSNKSD
ncbi:retinal short-chain dehydrogenase/reductase [Coprinopsis cinerea okayama7|uniref:Short-chain dehydrogenase/reductase 3 n=1 Tax=Coprinopsis cinerea (strain Okayama-7 / 130 / ATCC MYA-4618 / FGSC 9003) TaxID=240176 RepID=A8NYI9_COPC7|nr:retinal short-chain dehydrogenase/reductase [Coprinopsis cinerea okayama7\|eukprot:XP_001837439.1 retinal short-chain dehydrogenase/reductase [Coprinopsis cinerea okayama7\